MISIVLYGRNDNYGYNLHKRAAISFNCMAEVLNDPDDEILFVDYNTPNDFPTFPEAIQDTLTAKARERLRIFRVRPHIHNRFRNETRLIALEPVSRNIAIRRSNPANRWILSTNTDLIFTPLVGNNLNDIARDLPDGFYHTPRIEIPETLWESLDRYNPVETIETVRRWGWNFHLNEIVYGSDEILYDGPGDFQLIRRQDLFDYHGFDERMLLGWHVDSNIAKRLGVVYGKVGDLGDRVYGYHCDHTRQITPMHSHARTENSWRFFVEDVERPEIPSQAEQWGCVNDDIEEVRLAQNSAHHYVKALQHAIGEPLQEPILAKHNGDAYGDTDYSPSHAAPFILDLLVCAPKGFKVGWTCADPHTLGVIARAWRTLGVEAPIHVNGDAVNTDALMDAPGVRIVDQNTLIEVCDAFIFDFKGVPFNAAREDAPEGPQPQTKILQAFIAAVKTEQQRLEQGETLRQFVTLGTVNNDWGRLVSAYVACGHTPFSTRMRHGYVIPRVRERESWLSALTLGEAGQRSRGQVESIKGKRGCVAYGPYRCLGVGEYRLDMALEVKTPATGYDGDDICAVLDVRCSSHLLGTRVFTYNDLLARDHSMTFKLSEEDAAWRLASVEVQLRLPTPAEITLSRLNIAGIPQGEDIEQVQENTTRINNLMPLLDLGEAGRFENGDVQAEKGLTGYLVSGPYLTLLPGKYEARFKIENICGAEDTTKPLGAADVTLNANTIAALTLYPVDIDNGWIRLLFEVPSGHGEACLIETRVRSNGSASFALTSVHLSSTSRTDLLPHVAPTESSSRDGSSILTNGKTACVIAEGSVARLKAGRYLLNYTLSPDGTDNDAPTEKACAVLDVSINGNSIAKNACRPKGLTPDAASVHFEVTEADAASDSRIDIKLISATKAPLRLTRLFLCPADETNANNQDKGFTLLEDWLPFLQVNEAGLKTDEGVDAVEGSSAYVVTGPYWPLPPGSYEARFYIEGVDDTEPENALADETGPEDLHIGEIDIAVNTQKVCEYLLSADDVHNGPLSLAFDVPLTDDVNAAQPSSIETRVFSNGTIPFRIRSISVVQRNH